jgi:hypothetical protein
MDNVSSNTVEVFSTGIISCIAPQEIADRFSDDLVESERKAIRMCFDHYIRIHPHGADVNFLFSVENRIINMDYFHISEDKIDGKSIQCRIVKLEIGDEDA